MGDVVLHSPHVVTSACIGILGDITIFLSIINKFQKTRSQALYWGEKLLQGSDYFTLPYEFRIHKSLTR